MSDSEANSFEKALSELEQLVELLEKGDLPLEKTLEHFERGIALTRNCQQALRDAEQKVEILLEKTEGGQPQRLDRDQEN